MRLTAVADAGHSTLGPGVRTALVAAVERFRRKAEETFRPLPAQTSALSASHRDPRTVAHGRVRLLLPPPGVVHPRHPRRRPGAPHRLPVGAARARGVPARRRFVRTCPKAPASGAGRHGGEGHPRRPRAHTLPGFPRTLRQAAENRRRKTPASPATCVAVSLAKRRRPGPAAKSPVPAPPAVSPRSCRAARR